MRIVATLASIVLALGLAAPRAEAQPKRAVAPAAPAAGTIRVYMAGESIERRNRWVAPPFTASGALNDRGGGALRIFAGGW